MSVLNAGVTPEPVDGRMSMNRVSTAKNSPFLIGVRPNFVDKPLAHARDFEGDTIIPDEILHSLLILFLRWEPTFMWGLPARFLKQNHDPLAPRLHHSHDNEPAPLRGIGLHDPMEISNSMRYMSREIDIDHDVESQREGRCSREWKS